MDLGPTSKMGMIMEEVKFDSLSETPETRAAILDIFHHSIETTLDILHRNGQGQEELVEQILDAQGTRKRCRQQLSPDEFRACKKHQRHAADAVQTLLQWLWYNLEDPYPTAAMKVEMMKMTGLNTGQLRSWFINARRRVHGKLLAARESGVMTLDEALSWSPS